MLLSSSGDYANQRHSPLTQITPENVHRLAGQWAFQTDTSGKFEAIRKLERDTTQHDLFRAFRVFRALRGFGASC